MVEKETKQQQVVKDEGKVVWSIDDGYGDIKAYNGRKNGGEVDEDESLNQWEYFNRTGFLLMPSHVMLDVDRRTDSFGGLQNDIDPLSYVRVKYNGRKYIVGLGAVQQDENAKWLGEENKHNHMFFPVLLATTLGLLSNKEKELVDTLVMGLPVNAEKEESRKEQLRSLVLGKTHEVEIELADGKKLNRKVVVNDLKITSQPIGSFCSLLLNEDGSYKHKELAFETVSIADLGTKTFNICTMEAGFNIIELLTKNTNDGMMEAYRRINQEIQDTLGYELPEGKLSEALKTNKLDGFDIESSKKFNFEYQAQRACSEYNKVITNYTALISTVIWTGGGTEVCREFIPSKIDSRLKNKKLYFLNRFSTALGLRNFGLKF